MFCIYNDLWSLNYDALKKKLREIIGIDKYFKILVTRISLIS